jgi:hypothetical protein
MEDGKGACKSNDITATSIRKALPTSGNQQSGEREQVLPKKPRSALKKDLTAYFGDGKRSPVPTTAGNPIDRVIQCRELQPGTPKGKGGSKTEAGGKTDDTNSWHTPIVKKKRDKSKATPHDAEDEEGRLRGKTEQGNRTGRAHSGPQINECLAEKEEPED